MRSHYSPSSRENATPSSGTSPSVASYKEVAPHPPPPGSSLASGVERVESGAVIERGGEGKNGTKGREEGMPRTLSYIVAKLKIR